MNRPFSQNSPLLVPGAEPSLLRGGLTACLLLHGFSSNPEEMQPLAEDLHRRGYTILNLRLAGHGTDPRDLARTRWSDWLLSVEEALALLKNVSSRTVVVGQSMGGMIALTAAARYPLAGVVALSTPYSGFPPLQVLLARLLGPLGLTAHKQVKEHPDLGARREAFYPAYARYPVRIIVELSRLNKAMQKSLTQIRIPALVAQSPQDLGGGRDLEQIYAALGSESKEKLWLDGFDHSLVRDEKCQVVFDAIARFVDSL